MKKNKLNTNKNPTSAKKFASELPPIAKKYNIRVSNPYGFYPEDVEKILYQLEKDINNLELDSKQLRDVIKQKEDEISDLREQLRQARKVYSELQMQIQNMDYPDVSAEMDFANLSRISMLNGKSEPQIMDKVVDGPPIMPMAPVEDIPSGQSTHKATHNDLVRPKLNIKNKKKGE